MDLNILLAEASKIRESVFEFTLNRRFLSETELAKIVVLKAILSNTNDNLDQISQWMQKHKIEGLIDQIDQNSVFDKTYITNVLKSLLWQSKKWAISKPKLPKSQVRHPKKSGTYCQKPKWTFGAKSPKVSPKLRPGTSPQTVIWHFTQPRS